SAVNDAHVGAGGCVLEACLWLCVCVCVCGWGVVWVGECVWGGWWCGVCVIGCVCGVVGGGVCVVCVFVCVCLSVVLSLQPTSWQAHRAEWVCMHMWGLLWLFMLSALSQVPAQYH